MTSVVTRAARKAPFRLTPPTVLEHPLQEQIARVLTLEIAPAGKVSDFGVTWWSIDHANYAGTVPGVRIARGIIAGIPDIFLLWRGLTHYVEVKTVDGQLSAHQQSVAAAVIASGGQVGVVRDWIETLQCLDTWGIPRRRRVTA